MEIRLRAAGAEDFEFLLSVRRITMKSYAEATWGVWNEGAQQNDVRSELDRQSERIIIFGGKDVGCLNVEDLGDALFVHFIGILPEYQRRGLGTRLMQQVLAEGDQKQIPVRLNVLRVNPALSLYERLGFRIVGGDEYRHHMERSSLP